MGMTTARPGIAGHQIDSLNDLIECAASWLLHAVRAVGQIANRMCMTSLSPGIARAGERVAEVSGGKVRHSDSARREACAERIRSACDPTASSHQTRAAIIHCGVRILRPA